MFISPTLPPQHQVELCCDKIPKAKCSSISIDDREGFCGVGRAYGGKDDNTCATGTCTKATEKDVDTCCEADACPVSTETRVFPGKSGVTETCCHSCAAEPADCAAWVIALTKGCYAKCTTTSKGLEDIFKNSNCDAAQKELLNSDAAQEVIKNLKKVAAEKKAKEASDKAIADLKKSNPNATDAELAAAGKKAFDASIAESAGAAAPSPEAQLGEGAGHHAGITIAVSILLAVVCLVW